jgi:diguanylate cyclase (GGDEF)-like protein
VAGELTPLRAFSTRFGVSAQRLRVDAAPEMRVTIRMKMLFGFGVVVALMLVVGLFSVARLGHDNQHLDLLATRVVPSTRAVGDVNALMNKFRKDQLHYIVARPSDRPLSADGSIAGDLRDDLSLMRRSLQKYESGRLVEDQRDRELFEAFKLEFSRYVTITAGFRKLADRGRLLDAGAVVGNGAGDEQWDKLKGLIASWNDHKVATAAAEQHASSVSYRFSVGLILALLIAAVGIGIAVAIVMARRLTRAVRSVGAAAKAISQGDINQRVTVRSRDELGEMAGDFDAMVEYLRSTVAIAESIADGDLDVEVHPRSELDALGNSLAVMAASLRRLVAEAERRLAQTSEEANTDALTALPNRRALMRDLEGRIAEASDENPLTLALFDLDGFKQYNDTFGHSAGDALLVRLGDRLQRALGGSATGYRMGGDEFCVLASNDVGGGAAVAGRAASALSEKGEAFTIGCSYGVVSLPTEVATAEEALRTADKRMYEIKTGRTSASRQSTDVLLKALSERDPGLGDHFDHVMRLAVATANTMGLPEHEVKRIELAAQLHDIGKVAIPDSILNKPGPLAADEWDFIRRHTEIGERIVIAAPSLAFTAELIRSSHERYDGTGYPDRLAGDEIPLGARIISVCDAFGAMTTTRAYSDAVGELDALDELRRCSGAQFDPDVVTAFCKAISEAALIETAA